MLFTLNEGLGPLRGAAFYTQLCHWGCSKKGSSNRVLQCHCSNHAYQKLSPCAKHDPLGTQEHILAWPHREGHLSFHGRRRGQLVASATQLFLPANCCILPLSLSPVSLAIQPDLASLQTQRSHQASLAMQTSLMSSSRCLNGRGIQMRCLSAPKTCRSRHSLTGGSLHCSDKAYAISSILLVCIARAGLDCQGCGGCAAIARVSVLRHQACWHVWLLA